MRPADEVAAVAIHSLLGETDAPTSAEEIAWAVRKLLKQACRRAAGGPLRRHPVGGGPSSTLMERRSSSSRPTHPCCFIPRRPELTEQQPAWPVAVRLGR